MHEVLVNRLGGLSLPRKSVVRLTGRPDMTLDVYRGRILQQHNNNNNLISVALKGIQNYRYDKGVHQFHLFHIRFQQLCHIVAVGL